MTLPVINFLLRAYKALFSPVLFSSCRFTPTCSEYAAEAVERHGVLRGGMLAAWRILRCNPLTHGGLDTVPAKLFQKHARIPICHIGAHSAHRQTRVESGVSASSREQSAGAQRLAAEPWS